MLIEELRTYGVCGACGAKAPRFTIGETCYWCSRQTFTVVLPIHIADQIDLELYEKTGILHFLHNTPISGE